MNTPDTEVQKTLREEISTLFPNGFKIEETGVDVTDQVVAIFTQAMESLLTSRDTYWKERVGDINKSFVDFMESFVENGDNEIDLESLEEWRQHTLLDNLK